MKKDNTIVVRVTDDMVERLETRLNTLRDEIPGVDVSMSDAIRLTIERGLKSEKNEH